MILVSSVSCEIPCTNAEHANISVEAMIVNAADASEMGVEHLSIHVDSSEPSVDEIIENVKHSAKTLANAEVSTMKDLWICTRCGNPCKGFESVCMINDLDVKAIFISFCGKSRCFHVATEIVNMFRNDQFCALETIDHPKNRCNRCRSAGDLLACSRCREVKYCSKECQRANWKSHKPLCEAFIKMTCASCGKRETYPKVCAGCRSVRYCSNECQTTDWSRHKDDCR